MWPASNEGQVCAVCHRAEMSRHVCQKLWLDEICSNWGRCIYGGRKTGDGSLLFSVLHFMNIV